MRDYLLNIQNMSIEELERLAVVLREQIVRVVGMNGGHLASNLGVVELTLAIHRVFQSPKDPIIWDVGHQSYVHKLLTGREQSFDTLRQKGGISGFPKRAESEHDAFNTGHSSTAMSAAVGLARAMRMDGKDQHVVAVVGDGAFTGGMVWEALNDAGHNRDRVMVILNDNEMSITQSVGAMASYLSRIRVNRGYERLKAVVMRFLEHIPVIGKRLLDATYRMKNSLKYLLIPGVFFEEIGFKYFGPVDGHNLPQLLSTMKKAKAVDGPVLVHVVTQKGKGYSFSEQNPEKYHATAPSELIGDKPLAFEEGCAFSAIFGQKLSQLAAKDTRICAVTAAMPESCGLGGFLTAYPERYFDVGIAEQHAVTMAAGLAVGGKRPFFVAYATFMQRAYDQILHDVCLQNLPVVFAFPNTGVVGPDGETHQGIYTYAMLCSIPNLVVLAPANGQEFADMLEWAALAEKPVAICYGKSFEPGEWSLPYDPKRMEGWIWANEDASRSAKVAVLAAGRMVRCAIEAVKQLPHSVDVVNCRFLNPLDEAALRSIFSRYDVVYTLEDQVTHGGLGSGVCYFWATQSDIEREVVVRCLGHETPVVEQGTMREQLEISGLLPCQVAQRIAKDLGWRYEQTSD